MWHLMIRWQNHQVKLLLKLLLIKWWPLTFHLEHVRYFLDALLDYTRPHARNAIHALSERKMKHLGLESLPVIQAWDREYYCPPEPPAPSIPLPPLTPGTVFMALSRLFKHLYGISLRPVEAAPGELWHHHVRKPVFIIKVPAKCRCVTYSSVFSFLFVFIFTDTSG